MTTTNNPTYLFELGREPTLSVAEIFAYARVCGRTLVTKKQTKNHLIVEADTQMNANDWMKRLGGTVKIGRALPETPADVRDRIAEHLASAQSDGKIIFSISGHNPKKTALTIKKILKADGRSVRYIEANNTATILHNNLTERQGDITVIDHMAFVTEAIQDIEAFGERDYGRPGREAKRGMLPPKLAKMMINLTETHNDATLLDPFCGSGTVLMEAALLGYTHLFGSDASAEAVADTKKSLDWLLSTYALDGVHAPVHKSDASHIDTIIDPESVDCIVSEPYLGKPLSGNEPGDMLKKQTDELKTLYVNAFRAFYRLLKPGGVVVFVIPSFRYADSWIRIDVQKEIERLGFVTIPLQEKTPFIRYARKNQHVGREIWKWQKK